MSKNLILFDIDRVLFDNDKFVLLKRDRLSEISGKSFEEIEVLDVKAAEELRKENKYFLPSLYCKKLSEYLGDPLLFTQIESVFLDKKLFLDCIYPDVIEVLDDLKDSVNLGIYSWGFKENQLLKLKNLGIDKYFNPSMIILTPSFEEKISMTKEVLEKYSNFAAIDDELLVAKSWVSCKIALPIHLVRKGDNKGNLGPSGPIQAQNLYQVRDLVFEYLKNH